MQLTFDEVRDALNDAQGMSPQEWEREVADYIPQGIVSQLQTEAFRIWEPREGQDQAVSLTAAMMVGVVLGWKLSRAVFDEAT